MDHGCIILVVQPPLLTNVTLWATYLFSFPVDHEAGYVVAFGLFGLPTAFLPYRSNQTHILLLALHQSLGTHITTNHCPPSAHSAADRVAPGGHELFVSSGNRYCLPV